MHPSPRFVVPAQSKLALEWREWLTERLTSDYFADRSFYQVQAGSLLDNPDQRISSDIRCRTPLIFKIRVVELPK